MPPNTVPYSGPCVFCSKITGSVLVSSLLKQEPIEVPKKWIEGKTFRFCKPKSLVEWEKRNGVNQEKHLEGRYFDITGPVQNRSAKHLKEKQLFDSIFV